MVEFRVLGPVEAIVEGRPVPMAAAKPRALLAILLLERNRVVSVDRLVDGLWGERPPETANKALQGYVSQLRKALGPERVLTKPPGYSLRIEEGELDLERFEELVARGRRFLAEGAPEDAAQCLAEALDLWRGRAMDEFTAEPFAREAGARLEELRLGAVEERIEADLALGRHAPVVPELEELSARYPLRERLRAQLMIALYRCDRQAEALELYRRTRETLVDELGIEPSSALQDLERAILRHDPALALGKPGRRHEESMAPSDGGRRRLLFVLVLALAAAAAAALAIALIGRDSSKDNNTELHAFVSKVENFLVQSRDGRRAVSRTVGAAFDCKLSPPAAAVQLNRVQRNRQSLLQQLAAVSVPDDPHALRVLDLLQQAAHASIAADWHYRDWLQGRTRCTGPDQSPELVAARAADKKATETKQRFLAVFDPLARRFDERVWTAGEF